MMSWKRSEDGGLDYDVSTELSYRKAKEKMFGKPNVKSSSLDKFRDRIKEKKLKKKRW